MSLSSRPYSGHPGSLQAARAYNDKDGYDSSRDIVSGSSSDDVLPNDNAHNLHRGLKARHISMIAIGGAIGTGLIIGT